LGGLFLKRVDSLLHLYDFQIGVNLLASESDDVLLLLVEGGVVAAPLLVALAGLIEQEISLEQTLDLGLYNLQSFPEGLLIIGQLFELVHLCCEFLQQVVV